MSWLEIDKVRTTSYKPSTNGAVERFHRTLNAMLGKVISESQRDWDERVPFVMMAYRASVHSSTQFTPNKLFLGRENRMPIDLVMGLQTEEMNKSDSIDDFVQKQQEVAERAFQLARENLHENAKRRKTMYDIRVKKCGFAENDWVWYHYPRRYTRRSPKWQRNYTGPYRVVRVIPPVNYVLQKSPKSTPFVVHSDKIKKCHNPPASGWAQPAVERQDDAEQEVDMSVRPRKPAKRVTEKQCSQGSHEADEVLTPRLRRPPSRYDDYVRSVQYQY